MNRLFATRPRSGLLIDVAAAAAALVGSLAMLSHGGVPGSSAHLGSGELAWTGGLLAACASLPLVAWRRSALGVFAVTASASALLGGLGYAVGVPLGPTAALYLLAASRHEGDPWTPRTTATVSAFLGAFLTATGLAEGGFPGTELFHTALAWGAAWFAGERTRLRREHIVELRDRALRAEWEAEGERRLAVAEERSRIARDLHDSAGHAINVIAVRAGAARLGHQKNPDRSRLALEAIEEVARRTVDEIDQIVSTLRDDRSATGPVEVPSGLASVDTLIAHHTSAGLDVSVGTSGAPHTLASTVDQAAYRILQEALTNAARHGAGTARIELAFGESALELTVVNPVLAGHRARSARGHGLTGMRERATMVGGSLDAERANGAFRVHAHLPYGTHRR